MLDIQIHGGEVRISGCFDCGYMGLYDGEKIHLYDKPDRLRDWKTVRERLGPDCSDDALSACLTEYFNAFEEKIQKNRKQVNDNFLILAFEDWEACGYPFWEISGLTRSEFLPPDPDENVYNPYWDEMNALESAYQDAPNDGTQEKPDVEALLGRCRFSDCRHQSEPGCAVRAAIEAGELSPQRWESYQKLQAENAASDRAALLRQKWERNKAISKAVRGQEKLRRKGLRHMGE